MNLLELVFI